MFPTKIMESVAVLWFKKKKKIIYNSRSRSSVEHPPLYACYRRARWSRRRIWTGFEWRWIGATRSRPATGRVRDRARSTVTRRTAAAAAVRETCTNALCPSDDEISFSDRKKYLSVARRASPHRTVQLSRKNHSGKTCFSEHIQSQQAVLLLRPRSTARCCHDRKPLIGCQ